eukprot:scaffold4_cov396-Prasinococcus_capsulatus_cf.AAC.6
MWRLADGALAQREREDAYRRRLVVMGPTLERAPLALFYAGQCAYADGRALRGPSCGLRSGVEALRLERVVKRLDLPRPHLVRREGLPGELAAAHVLPEALQRRLDHLSYLSAGAAATCQAQQSH